MKKTNTFLMLIILVTFAFSTSAQVNFGIKVGGNLSNIKHDYKDSDYEYATKMKVGFHIGLTSDIPINDMFSFQPGLLFTTKGWSYDLDELFDEFDPVRSVSADGLEIDGYARTSLNYLELPLNVAFKANALQIYAGPYLGIGIGGKHKNDYTVSFMGDSETFKDDYKLKSVFGEVKEGDLEDDEDAFTALDFGLNFGVGYTVGPVLIQAGYSLGLGNINPKYEGMSDTDRSDYKDLNRVITLSVSYFFGE
jgi:hypothetical protein